MYDSKLEFPVASLGRAVIEFINPSAEGDGYFLEKSSCVAPVLCQVNLFHLTAGPGCIQWKPDLSNTILPEEEICLRGASIDTYL